MPPDPSVVLVQGPWRHRDVGANGQKFHVAELGDGPLVLLLHGFPQFWWCWRAQLVGLAEAGFRAVAVDLRGYGGSDKPPRGYDALTLSGDISGLVRALGEQRAVIVGHDWGGFLGWSVSALHPAVVSKLVVLSLPHPLALRRALRRSGPQWRASAHLLRFQLPWKPERDLVADDAALVGALLAEWGGPDFPYAAVQAEYRQHMQIPGVAHSALEYFRWAVRSQARPDGARFARSLQRLVTAPTLQLTGTADTCVLPETVRASSEFVAGPYRLVELPGVGHFPAEERPEQVTALIADWAAG
ncbi:MAG TPA: alpha/beta hydrolase [Mycobacteriales bacterium]|nr:alpha/beta hydrolase [Mycobacteriales bacterium]